MRKLLAAVALLILVPMWASAQNAEKQSRGEGYFFFGPLVSNTRYEFNPACYGVVYQPGQQVPAYCNSTERSGVNAGFGGEAFVYKGLGAGIEFGYAGQNWKFNGDGIGVGSLDASYHFRGWKAHKKIEPFVVGGYSLYFGDRTASQSGFNFGGGMNLWFSKHAALRLEVREQDHINYFHSGFTRFAAFRVGMTFR